MGRGIIAFLVLLAFVPMALYAITAYVNQATAIAQTKQLLIEQQAITIKEQDFEESFWRAMQYSDSPAEWAREMRKRGIDVWYGDPRNNPTAEPIVKVTVSKTGKRLVSVPGNRYDAIGATITVGSSKGIYIIPMGCSREYD